MSPYYSTSAVLNIPVAVKVVRRHHDCWRIMRVLLLYQRDLCMSDKGFVTHKHHGGWGPVDLIWQSRVCEIPVAPPL